MKKTLCILGVCLSVFAQAQMKQGRIVYERTIQMQIRMANMDPALEAQLPKSRTDQFELLFGNNQSLWQILPTINAEDQNTIGSPGGGMVIRMGGGSGINDVSFQDLDKGTRVDQRSLFDRDFIVADSIKKLSWKLSDETKTVLNYTAHKAVAQRISTRSRMTMENGVMQRTDSPDTATVVAWYTTDIPVSGGPSEFEGQLPGMILELDIDNGKQTYKAVEVSPKVNLSKIKEPKQGKKLTPAEFTVEREKMMEEMRKNMGGNGNTFRIQQ